LVIECQRVIPRRLAIDANVFRDWAFKASEVIMGNSD
jgi:hypothetical protein